MTIYKETSGKGSDVVTLHGWSCNQRHMQPIVDLLKHRYRVTNVNLPGISHTSWPADTKTIHDVADQIIADLPENAIYIGWSFGGLVSMSSVKKMNHYQQRCTHPFNN